MMLRLLPVLCFLFATSNQAMAQDKRDAAPADMQKHFAEAYNRGDLDAMAVASTLSLKFNPVTIFKGTISEPTLFDRPQ
jgi:hypothetical protein